MNATLDAIVRAKALTIAIMRILGKGRVRRGVAPMSRFRTQWNRRDST
jgi:hypothetical protein